MEAWKFFRLLICITFYFHRLQALESSYYMGCFKDDIFRKAIWPPITNFNNGDRCIRTCRASGHTFAATQSHYCKCAMSIGGNPQQVRCQYKCPGYQNEICGGSNSMSVYYIRSQQPFGYVGCYEKSTFGKNIMTTVTRENHGTYCINVCKTLMYRYAGTQGTFCKCGHSIRSHSKRTDCTFVCAGPRNEYCGGLKSMSVYDIRLTKAVTPKTTETHSVVPNTTLIISTDTIEELTEPTTRNEIVTKAVTPKTTETHSVVQNTTLIISTDTIEELTEPTTRNEIVTKAVTPKTTETHTVVQNTTLIISTDSIEELTEPTTRNEIVTKAVKQKTTETHTAVPNTTLIISTDTREELTEPTTRNENRTLWIPAEIYTSIQAGVILIVAIVAGVIVLIRRKKRLQHEISLKNSLYKSSKSDGPNRTVGKDDDNLNTSLESELPSRVTAKANNDNILLSELLQSQIPRSTAAHADENLSGILQSNVYGLNVGNADIDYVTEPSVHTNSVAVHDFVNEPGVRTVSVTVHNYVDTNYDELVSQRVDEHSYVPLTT
ncbi:uncharacterized protein LOC128557835 isoform X2 [Mercenaria mercenaria]|uniref:uncharacterized protein LOC128557835 isoform X2 n=1 Tax=Mercenaria mercenaria TaxID=6596 RepID=UPI00234EDD14|nr:uncharacterized protein LOC128557835 isoform X2 [Mercenaria mercenaria]